MEQVHHEKDTNLLANRQKGGGMVKKDKKMKKEGVEFSQSRTGSYNEEKVKSWED